MLDLLHIADISAAVIIFLSLTLVKKHRLYWVGFSVGHALYAVVGFEKNLPGLAVLSILLTLVGIGICCDKPENGNPKLRKAGES